MKKTLWVFFALLTAVSLGVVACSDDDSDDPEPEPTTPTQSGLDTANANTKIDVQVTKDGDPFQGVTVYVALNRDVVLDASKNDNFDDFVTDAGYSYDTEANGRTRLYMREEGELVYIYAEDDEGNWGIDAVQIGENGGTFNAEIDLAERGILLVQTFDETGSEPIGGADVWLLDQSDVSAWLPQDFHDNITDNSVTPVAEGVTASQLQAGTARGTAVFALEANMTYEGYAEVRQGTDLLGGAARSDELRTRASQLLNGETLSILINTQISE